MRIDVGPRAVATIRVDRFAAQYDRRSPNRGSWQNVHLLLTHLRSMPFRKKCSTVQLDNRCFWLSTFCAGSPMRSKWSMAMWQKLSLRARLNTLLALVMVLGLVINIARLLLEAGPRVAAEDQSVVRLARGFVETLVSNLNDAPDPEARLDQIVEGLKQLRHVSITRERHPDTGRGPARSAPPGGASGPPQVPACFLPPIPPPPTKIYVPLPVTRP